MSDNGKSYALYEALQENDQLRARVAEQQAALESICTFSWGAGEPFDAGRAASRMQEVAELAIDDVPRTQAFILRKQAEAVQASREALEGEPVAVVDRVGIMQRLSPYTNLPEGTKLYTHPASAATLQFGNGNLVVTGGSFDDVPAVFISPAIDLGNAPGTALSGKDAERRTDMLYGDETVLLFKTAEHASVVVGALIRGNDASADKWIKCSEQRPNVLDVWIKMTDGSVVACWAQLDGDFYWKGGGSESFILEHTVTHWKPRQEEQGHE